MSAPECQPKDEKLATADDELFLNELWSDCWRPPDRVPVWQWAEQHIEAIPYSPMPGRFHIDNSPQIRDVMQEIVNPRTRLVSIIASVQSGKTTAPEITLNYIIANVPGPTLWLCQTDDDARDVSESRMQKLFDNCAPVKALYPPDKNKKRNTTIHFSNGMTLWMAGAYNRKNLQTRSIRWLIGDETWLWPQGHMAEAEARVTAFGWLGKCVFMSQGGFAGDDTHKKFETTDKREWHFQCPECGAWQPFLWECIKWPKECRGADGEFDFRILRANTRMQCAHCEHEFVDSDETRRKLNATAKFIPLNPKAAAESVGFHWNALCAMPWGMLAELYLRAKLAAKKGDYSQLQQFYQKRLGLAWDEFKEDYKIELVPSDYHMGDSWAEEGSIGGIPLRVLTVDVQRDHFVLVVRSWSLMGASRMVHCAKVLSYDEIAETEQRMGVHPSLVFVDAGYNTYEVYSECATHGWVALMGDKRNTFPHRIKGGKSMERFYSPKRKVNLGRQSNGKDKIAQMFFWSNLNIKDTLARLRKNTEGATWEVPADSPVDYLNMLDSEYRVHERGRWVWQQIGHRPNHYLDCEAMQAAAATMLKIIGAESIGSLGDDSVPRD